MWEKTDSSVVGIGNYVNCSTTTWTSTNMLLNLSLAVLGLLTAYVVARIGAGSIQGIYDQEMKESRHR